LAWHRCQRQAPGSGEYLITFTLDLSYPDFSGNPQKANASAQHKGACTVVSDAPKF